MSFRRRITLLSAAAVAVAVVLASVLTYVLASGQLRSQVDAQLRARDRGAGLLRALRNANLPDGAVRPGRLPRGLAPARGADGLAAPVGSALPPGRRPSGAGRPDGAGFDPFPRLPPGPNQVRGYQQLLDAGGRVIVHSDAGFQLPVDGRTRALAVSGGTPFLRDARVNGVHLRVLAEPLRADISRPGPAETTVRAAQFAQPLTDVDNLLGRLRLILGALDVGGIALGAMLGRLVAGAAVAPIKRLTQASEHVTHTQDLSERIEPSGHDEIGRLAVSFNAMLDALAGSMSALDASVTAQRQLVADASHELRTPVTSLRTNIEYLQEAGDMPASDRRQLLEDVVEQIDELTLLMNDLIELARGEQHGGHVEEVRLDLIVEEATARARRHSPGRQFRVRAEEALVSGESARIDRAVNNLIDNAVKYSPPDRPVEVTVNASGELCVRDHGAGIATDDLPHVFDRFYRGAEARGRPGSGLGLAIVRQVAESHAGSVSAERAPGGGTLMRLSLHGLPRAPDEQDLAAEGATAAAPMLLRP